MGVWTPNGTRRATLYNATRAREDTLEPGGHSGAATSTEMSSNPDRDSASLSARGEKWLTCTRLSASVARYPRLNRARHVSFSTCAGPHGTLIEIHPPGAS